MEKTVNLNAGMEKARLEIFEHLIRTQGLWCVQKSTDKLRHFFVCKHPRASIAISMCGQVVSPFGKIHEATDYQKCMVCDLYAQARKEVQLRLFHVLNELLDRQPSTNQPNQKESL